MDKRPTPKNIDEYIAAFPANVQKILQQIRILVAKTVPDATEAISYQIPCFKLGGKNLVHFAAFKNHVSVYPAPRGVEEFNAELAAYKGGKGTVQFPLDGPLPTDLIVRIVNYRVDKLAAGKR
jgi:uncharacterized protein YdhG (YjbR/CyaY superfamily)